jgi:hypothetical protein
MHTPAALILWSQTHNKEILQNIHCIKNSFFSFFLLDSFHYRTSATYLKTNITVEKARKLLRTFAQHTYLPLPIQNKTKIQKVGQILILQ